MLLWLQSRKNFQLKSCEIMTAKIDAWIAMSQLQQLKANKQFAENRSSSAWKQLNDAWIVDELLVTNNKIYTLYIRIISLFKDFRTSFFSDKRFAPSELHISVFVEHGWDSIAIAVLHPWAGRGLGSSGQGSTAWFSGGSPGTSGAGLAAIHGCLAVPAF